MKTRSGKYIIGLTGNIATGKSIVRQMLEHLGAYGIDADKAAHTVLARGTPGYRSVVDEFGDEILAPSGEIDRQRLGKIVFQNHDALVELENITHPLVGKEIERLIHSSDRDVCVIEAIKLIEAGLHESCDTVWVTVARQQSQIERLINQRLMSEHEALIRINAQPKQEEKLPYASFVIKNEGSLQSVWEQVAHGWMNIFPDTHIPGGLPQPFEQFNG